MKALVTGGAGFIGSHVVDLLLKNGFSVSIIDNLASGDRKNVNPGASFYEIDICSPEMRDVFKNELPELIFHLAAQPSVVMSIQDPVYDERVNINGTLKILELAREFEAKKFIYSSSAAVYGDPVFLPITEAHPIEPIAPYGLSKWLAEQYIMLYFKMHQMDYTILRYANVYGPRQTLEGEAGVVSVFRDRMKQRKPVVVNGDGSNSRDFVYVGDVAEANLKAVEKGSCEIVNISTGSRVSLLELIKYLEDSFKYSVEIKYGPGREGDILHSSLDPTRALEILGWKAEVSLSEGLKRTVYG